MFSSVAVDQPSAYQAMSPSETCTYVIPSCQ
jgi:hypothetical protein